MKMKWIFCYLNSFGLARHFKLYYVLCEMYAHNNLCSCQWSLNEVMLDPAVFTIISLMWQSHGSSCNSESQRWHELQLNYYSQFKCTAYVVWIFHYWSFVMLEGQIFFESNTKNIIKTTQQWWQKLGFDSISRAFSTSFIMGVMMLEPSACFYQLHSYHVVIRGLEVSWPCSMETHTHTQSYSLFILLWSPVLLSPCLCTTQAFLRFRLHPNAFCFQKCGHLDVLKLRQKFTNTLYFTFSRPAISIQRAFHCDANELLRWWLKA